LAELAVGGVMLVDEQGIDGVLADHLDFLYFPFTAQVYGAALVFVEFSGDSVFELYAYQAARVAGAKPRLAFDDQCAERQFVAGKDEGFVNRVHACCPLVSKGVGS
jgi:hypothetical protein